METGVDKSCIRSTCPAVVKLRALFKDMSKVALNAAFTDFVNSVYYRDSDKAAAVKNCNSLNLIEFKIAIMKAFRDTFLFTEVKEIFVFFDSSKTGRVQRDQFILGMRVRSISNSVCLHVY
jgi:hypothetical protein